MFSLNFEIKKWESHEDPKERDTKEEVLISIRVNIPRDNDQSTYFLLPIKRVFILSFLRHFNNNQREDLNSFAEIMLMSDVVFISRLAQFLIEPEVIIEALTEILSLATTFEKQKEAILLFCDTYLVKEICRICKESDMNSNDFFEEQMEYAHKSGLYDAHIKAISSVISLAHSQSTYKDENFLAKTIENTFNEAIIYLKEINLSHYEEAIEKKILVDDMIDSAETLQDMFAGLTDKKKALGQLKIRNHPISFILNDIKVKSKHNKVNIFKYLCVGVINASVSVNIVKKLTKKDKEKFENHLKTLKQYNVDKEKLFYLESLINLCDSIKYINHIPTIAISNAYGGLSELQTYKLSKFLLSSINRDTVSAHYKNIHYINVYEQILFEE